MPDEIVSVRYLVDDVPAAIDFCTTHFGFTPLTSAPPAFADVQQGNLRLLLSGPSSSAGRAMDDGEMPVAGRGGTESTSSPPTSRERSIDYVGRASPSATTSWSAPAARRSS